MAKQSKSTTYEILRTQAMEAGLKWLELECISSDKESDCKPKMNRITVFECLGSREFFSKVGEFAALILFTAGLEDYARPLVDRIDIDNMISTRFCRPSTVSTEYQELVKDDLTTISKDLFRTVIVDNNPFCFLLQPLNGTRCVPFSAGQAQDDQVLDVPLVSSFFTIAFILLMIFSPGFAKRSEVLLPLLRQLSQEKDVRLVLYEKFWMPGWFQMHGIPAKAIAL